MHTAVSKFSFKKETENYGKETVMNGSDTALEKRNTPGKGCNQTSFKRKVNPS